MADASTRTTGESEEKPLSVPEELDNLRRVAQVEAGSELRRRGFTEERDGSWKGKLSLEEIGDVRATVVMPPFFPDELLSVVVERASLPKQAPHVEVSGKICGAPPSGVLIDASRPADLVAESLARATTTLEKGLLSDDPSEFLTELQSYWGKQGLTRTYSICSPSGESRVIARIEVTTGLPKSSVVFADNVEAGQRWVSNLRGTIGQVSESFFIRLQTPFVPPDFDEHVSVRALRRVAQKHAAPEDSKRFREWLNVTPLPAWILISVPGVEAAGPIVLGARVEAPKGDTKKKVQAGFRPHTIPPHRRIDFTLNEPITRRNLGRLDTQFLTARGGAAETLSGKVVTVIGVGAVGSPLGGLLASFGVGELRLVDPEALAPENVHRHYLGVRHLRRNKAQAMAEELSSRFPHLKFPFRKVSVQDLLHAEPEFLTEADLIVVALGDETLELRINSLLRRGPPRIHAWVEPLSLGGHALSCHVSREASPCFACLYVRDPEHGLINRSSLTDAGQIIQRTLAGCAGTFSPFSSLDAHRTALEAAQLAGRVLTGAAEESELVTWRGNESIFVAEGFRLSQRGHLLISNSSVSVPGRDLRRPDCAVCGNSEGKY